MNNLINDEVVLTGASGYIGSFLIKKLEELGIKYKAYSRNASEGISRIDSYYNLSSNEDQILIHLAQESISNVVNEDTEIELSNSLFNKPWKHIIYISSAQVYGEMSEINHSTNEKLSPYNSYTKVKLESEKIALNKNATILRFSNVYGREIKSNTLLFDIINQKDNNTIILRNLEPLRDFIWIDDAISAIISSIHIKPRKILNVACGEVIKIENFVKLVLKLLTIEEKKIKTTINLKNIKSCISIDIQETIKILDWFPKTNLKTGLLKTFEINNLI